MSISIKHYGSGERTCALKKQVNFFRQTVSLAVVWLLLVQCLPLAAFAQQNKNGAADGSLTSQISTTVVISELRFRGPSGASDEFIELYNLTDNSVDIGGWKIFGSNNSAGTSTRLTIAANTSIPAYGHFLATNSSSYSGSVPGNQTFGTGFTDDGGVALFDAVGVIVDQVGLSNGSAYKEGTVLTSLGSNNTDRCYERKPGNTSGNSQDTDDNSADFQLITPCNPQNLASPATPPDNPTPTPTPTVTPTPTPTPTVTPTPTPTPTPMPVVPQTLPFSQNWSNTNLITADNDWSGVPGIVGYRGDNLTSGTGTDPQTILADGSATPVNVIANQTTPNTITSGGIYEFEITDPVVAFQGSGTASAPHLVINLNTTGKDNVTIFYNLRDIDGSADDAVQPVALQYRLGNSGDYTNISAAYVADATTGPNLATLVTPVNVALPAAVNNQPLVQLRIITANAVGSDEFVGVDDISIVSGGTIPLSASGSATPGQVESGSAVLLKVSVNPATNPASTGITVSGNLTSIGGTANQTFYDDGTNGDITAGDNIFSYNATIPASSSGGNRTLPVTLSDAQTRTAQTSISLTVIAAADPGEHLVMGNPSGATTDVNNPTNYLLPKNQYVIGYHRDRGIPNWVSWHLDSSWIGSAPRQNDFRPDPSLPAGWYQVTQFDYMGSGFDRGHHTPSGDRTRSIPDNSATFFMTNMMPQAPDNNQGPWEELESFSRSLLGQNELYILGAGVGTGGTGSSGGVTTTIAGGKVTVPSYTWKVILVLPVGDNDVARVTANTRTIAVIMPNNQGIRGDAWQKYLATVDQVENLTGYDFFSNVPVDIQNVIESRLDAASQAASPQAVAAGTYTNLDVSDTPNKQLSGNITVTGNLNLGGTNLSTGSFCVTLGANATVSRTYGYINNCVEKQFTAPVAAKSSGLLAATAGSGINAAGKGVGTNAPAAPFEYPVGTNNGYSPVTANVTAVAQSPSSLSVRAVQGVQPNAPDANLALKRYWTLTESGDLTADLTFKYLDVDVPTGVSESSFTLQRYEGTFTEIPATIDPAANTATTTGSISQFSDWTLLAPNAPTAAGADISGRVTSIYGRAIAGATIVFTDGNGGTFTARTNPFGYYRLDEIPTGITYIVAVRHKGYFFAPQVVNLTENLDALDFTGTPGY